MNHSLLFVAVFALLLKTAVSQHHESKLRSFVKDGPVASVERITVPSAGIIRTYEEKDFNGRSHNHPIDSAPVCRSLDHGARSLVTYGACVELFLSSDCSGEYTIKIAPRHGFYFHDISFNHQPTRSFRGCSTRRSENDHAIELYSDAKFEGKFKRITLPGNECIDLEDMTDDVESVNTYEKCVQFFVWSKCSGDSIKVFPGAQFPHTDLSAAKFAGSQEPLANHARSVRRCSIDREDLKLPLPESAVVRVFNQTSLAGRFLDIDLSTQDSCHPLDITVRSINTHENCVQFFRSRDCSGPSRRVFPGAEFGHENLSHVNLVPMDEDTITHAKSLKRCHMP